MLSNIKNYFISMNVLALCLMLTGCLDDNVTYCSDVSAKPSSELNIFSSIQDGFEQVSGNRHAGILCHNCYSNNNDDLSYTLEKLYFALDENVDFLELDIVVEPENDGIARISHEASSTGVLLDDVLHDQRVLTSTSPIFIEIKTSITAQSDIENLLDNILSIKTNEGKSAYANSERMLILRSVYFDTTLTTLRDTLLSTKYKAYEKFVKLSRIQNFNSVKTTKAEVRQSYQCGLHMIELDSRLSTDQIKQVAKIARGLELAINVHTLDYSNYERYTTDLKNTVDVLTVEPCQDDSSSCSQTDIFRNVKLLLEKAE